MAEAKAPRDSTSTFGWSGFAIRWGAALALVLLTYNPLGWSYAAWVGKFEGDNLPLKVLVGLVLLTGHVVYLRATAGSLGTIGSVIFAAIFGVILWLLIDKMGTINSGALSWIVLFAASIYLALGMTGSFLWKRLTGQVDVAAEDHHDSHS